MRGKLILLGATALIAAAGMASPAAAQYYPYPGNGGVLGAIINGVVGGGYGGGYGNYGGAGYERVAVEQCMSAANARLNGASYGSPYGYPAPYGGGGYNQPYYGNGGARVLQVTGVERKSYGYHVRAVATSGSYGGAYGGYGAYGTPAGGADLKVNCKVESNGRIRDVAVRWLNSDRPYYGAASRGY